MNFMRNAPVKNPTNSLCGFCDLLANKYQSPPPEKIIAEEFNRYFRLSPPITLAILIIKLGSEINIYEHDLRGEARGLYAAYEGQRPHIIYDPKEAPANFTILHEIRHLIGNALETIGYCPTSERDCEMFAASVLMPEDMFIEDIIKKYGVDVARLSQKYAVSYSACCIKISEVVRCYFYIFRKEDKKDAAAIQLVLSNSGLPKQHVLPDKSLLCAIKTGERYYGRWHN